MKPWSKWKHSRSCFAHLLTFKAKWTCSELSSSDEYVCFSQGFKGFLKSFLKKEQHKREFSMKIRQKTEGGKSKQKKDYVVKLLIKWSSSCHLHHSLPLTSRACLISHMGKLSSWTLSMTMSNNITLQVKWKKKNTMTGAHAFLFFIHGLHFELRTWEEHLFCPVKRKHWLEAIKH